MKQDTVIGEINRVKHIYGRQVFRIACCNADLESDPLKNSLSVEGIKYGIDLNTSAKDEHVSEVEKHI